MRSTRTLIAAVMMFAATALAATAQAKECDCQCGDGTKSAPKGQASKVCDTKMAVSIRAPEGLHVGRQLICDVRGLPYEKLRIRWGHENSEGEREYLHASGPFLSPSAELKDSEIYCEASPRAGGQWVASAPVELQNLAPAASKVECDTMIFVDELDLERPADKLRCLVHDYRDAEDDKVHLTGALACDGRHPSDFWQRHGNLEITSERPCVVRVTLGDERGALSGPVFDVPVVNRWSLKDPFWKVQRKPWRTFSEMH